MAISTANASDLINEVSGTYKGHLAGDTSSTCHIVLGSTWAEYPELSYSFTVLENHKEIQTFTMHPKVAERLLAKERSLYLDNVQIQNGHEISFRRDYFLNVNTDSDHKPVDFILKRSSLSGSKQKSILECVDLILDN